KSIFLPILLILVVLGSIFTGIATPTEGAGVGVLGTVIIGVLSKRLYWPNMKESIYESMKMSGMVGWLLIGAAVFSAVFAGVGSNQFVAAMAANAPGGKWGILFFSLASILVLGRFL